MAPGISLPVLALAEMEVIETAGLAYGHVNRFRFRKFGPDQFALTQGLFTAMGK